MCEAVQLLEDQGSKAGVLSEPDQQSSKHASLGLLRYFYRPGCHDTNRLVPALSFTHYYLSTSFGQRVEGLSFTHSAMQVLSAQLVVSGHSS